MTFIYIIEKSSDMEGDYWEAVRGSRVCLEHTVAKDYLSIQRRDNNESGVMYRIRRYNRIEDIDGYVSEGFNNRGCEYK